MTAYRFHGVDDEADTCARCGRTGLKRVVWLSRLDSDGNPDEEPQAYGCDCAGELLAGRKTTSNTRRVQEHGRRLENVRTQLAAAWEHLARTYATAALVEEAGARVLRVSSMRREEGLSALEMGTILKGNAQQRVAELRAQLADLETVEVTDQHAAA